MVPRLNRDLVALLGLLLLGGPIALTAADAAPQVTFDKDIAPIVYAHCAACHRPNDIAPMSLLTYREARPWAAAMRQAVMQGVMPPWHADPHIGEYINDPRLSAKDIATIDAWVKSGAKEGSPKDLPPQPELTSG